MQGPLVEGRGNAKPLASYGSYVKLQCRALSSRAGADPLKWRKPRRIFVLQCRALSSRAGAAPARDRPR